MGEKNRKYASSNFNHKSSRSHVIFSVTLNYINNKLNSNKKSSTIYFVDLAGNE